MTQIERLLSLLSEPPLTSTMRSSLMMYGTAVAEVWETSIDPEARSLCERSMAWVELILEALGEIESTCDPASEESEP